MTRGVSGEGKMYFKPEEQFLGKQFKGDDKTWEDSLEKTKIGAREARERARKFSNFERKMQEVVKNYFGDDLDLTKKMPPESFFLKLEGELDSFGYEAAFIANYFKDIIEEEKDRKRKLH